MTVITKTFDYVIPATVAEAAAQLERPGALALAGGSEVVIALKQGRIAPAVVVDLQHLRELRGIEQQGDELRVGALTTCAELSRQPQVRQRLQALSEAIDCVADSQVRNTATIGGNLAGAYTRGKSADLAAAALALDAMLLLRNRQDAREVSAESFYAQADRTALATGELVEAIYFPMLHAGSGSAYVKFRNPASDYALSGVAASVTLSADKTVTYCRVAVVGATVKPERLTNVEHALIGQIANDAAVSDVAGKAKQGLSCINDLAASADYRAHLTTVMVERALKMAIDRAMK